jgi:hypothetical protein
MADDEDPKTTDSPQEKLPVGIMFCAAALGLALLLAVVAVIAFAAMAPRAPPELQPVNCPAGGENSISGSLRTGKFTELAMKQVE